MVGWIEMVLFENITFFDILEVTSVTVTHTKAKKPVTSQVAFVGGFAGARWHIFGGYVYLYLTRTFVSEPSGLMTRLLVCFLKSLQCAVETSTIYSQAPFWMLLLWHDVVLAVLLKTQDLLSGKILWCYEIISSLVFKSTR